jgi:hypothetical protein
MFWSDKILKIVFMLAGVGALTCVYGITEAVIWLIHHVHIQ